MEQLESKKIILLEKHFTKQTQLKKQWLEIKNKIKELEQLQIKK